tara:strand:- start:307 stop:468 length:162 start_codon:yes stop_codon:yes gene_type:complete
MSNIKPGALVKNQREKPYLIGLLLRREYVNKDWYYVLVNGKKRSWHISNIDLV